VSLKNFQPLFQLTTISQKGKDTINFLSGAFTPVNLKEEGALKKTLATLAG
jgi:hypothetical protein